MPVGIQDSQPPKAWFLPDESSPPRAFHLDVCYETSGKARKCKTNCRNIEIPLLYPSFDPTTKNHAGDADHDAAIPGCGLACQNAGNGVSPMLIDTADKEARATPSTAAFQEPASIIDIPEFPTSPSPSLLTLPLELRLEIYSYLLPPQTHTIITQYPANGLYYSSTPEYSTQSLYPHASSPSPSRPTLTTYHIPHRKESIYTEILRVCKQTYEEAEPVLYGGKGVVFNFESYLDAVLPFLQDRNAGVWGCVRELRVVVDIPKFALVDSACGDALVKNVGSTETGMKLREICEVFVGMKALRNVDLVVMGSFGEKMDMVEADETSTDAPTDPSLLSVIDADTFPSDADSSSTAVEPDTAWETSDAEIREVEWVTELLKMDNLSNIEVTWSNFRALA